MSSTLFQKLRKKSVPNNRNKKNKIGIVMSKAPLVRGVCLSVHKGSPKRPNSAQRTFIKCQINLKPNQRGVQYTKFKSQHKILSKVVRVYIPGEKNDVAPHSYVLFKPDKIQDLPGVNFSANRGKYDLNGVEGRKTSRSIYGVKRS